MRRILLVGALLLVGSKADALPLDIADPTPRSVRVEVERSIDLTVVGADYNAPVVGSWTSNGSTGRVSVPGVELAKIYEGFPFPPVPNLFTDFVIEIDLATREAIVEPYTAVFRHSTGVDFGFIADGLDTTAIGGVTFGTVFCVPPAPPGSVCGLVSGAPFEPTTGALNAIGFFEVPFNPESPGGFIPAMFDGNGDLRLTEVPEPSSGWLLAIGLGLAVARPRASSAAGARQPRALWRRASS